MFLTTGRLVTLSEQSILDGVTPKYQNTLGNNPYKAFELVSNDGGLEEDLQYPYQACRNDSRTTGLEKVNINQEIQYTPPTFLHLQAIKIKQPYKTFNCQVPGTAIDSCMVVPYKRQDQLMRALVAYGPICVPVSIPYLYYHFYKSGKLVHGTVEEGNFLNKLYMSWQA